MAGIVCEPIDTTGVIYLGFLIRFFFFFLLFFFVCASCCVAKTRHDPAGMSSTAFARRQTNDNDLLLFSLQPLAYIEVVRIQHTPKRSMFVWEREEPLCAIANGVLLLF